MDENSKKIAYVVLSCDPYSDIWDTYGLLFERFWPDCPYDRFMASHTKAFDKYGFKSLLIGEDLSWSHGLMVVIDLLEKKGYEYGIIAFDDLLICEKVDTVGMESAIKLFMAEKGQCLRFIPNKTSRCYKHNNLYGKLGVKVPYRVTVGFVLWDLKTLGKIVVDGESAWQFEKNATERSFDFKDFYCTWKSQFHWINLINKRKLDIKEYQKLLKILPNAKFDREKTYVKEEKFKGMFLKLLLKYVPIKWQYPIYKTLTKPINM